MGHVLMPLEPVRAHALLEGAKAALRSAECAMVVAFCTVAWKAHCEKTRSTSPSCWYSGNVQKAP